MKTPYTSGRIYFQGVIMCLRHVTDTLKRYNSTRLGNKHSLYVKKKLFSLATLFPIIVIYVQQYAIRLDAILQTDWRLCLISAHLLKCIQETIPRSKSALICSTTCNQSAIHCLSSSSLSRFVAITQVVYEQITSRAFLK